MITSWGVGNWYEKEKYLLALKLFTLVMYQGKSYLVTAPTIGDTQKAMIELKYRLETGSYIEK